MGHGTKRNQTDTSSTSTLSANTLNRPRQTMTCLRHRRRVLHWRPRCSVHQSPAVLAPKATWQGLFGAFRVYRFKGAGCLSGFDKRTPGKKHLAWESLIFQTASKGVTPQNGIDNQNKGVVNGWLLSGDGSVMCACGGRTRNIR